VDPLFDLTDRVVVVTGASSGLGASVARCFAERGARVVLSARRAELIADLATQLPNAIPITCDVTDERACRRLIDHTVEQFGRIDVLVNNAGSFAVTPAELEPIETFRSVLETNLVATFTLSQAASAHMFTAGRGSIINVSSIFGLVGTGQVPQASYSASKGGVVNLTRELAAQWARRGVRVNAIAPGYFRSEMTNEMFDDPASHEWVRRKTPMGVAGQLDDFHGPLVFLASDASSYITGVTIPVDGGWTAV